MDDGSYHQAGGRDRLVSFDNSWVDRRRGVVHTHTHTRKNPERFSPLSIDCNQLTPVRYIAQLSLAPSLSWQYRSWKDVAAVHTWLWSYTSPPPFSYLISAVSSCAPTIYNIISFSVFFFVFFASWRTSALAAMASSRMERNAIAERSRSVTIPILVAIPSRANWRQKPNALPDRVATIAKYIWYPLIDF